MADSLAEHLRSGWKDEVARLRGQGLSITAIASVVGMSRSRVGEVVTPHYCACGNERMRKAALCRACRDAEKRWCAERIEELVAGMYDDGWPLKDIADVLGRAYPTPARAAAAVGPELDRARRRGLIQTTRVRTGWGTWAPA